MFRSPARGLLFSVVCVDRIGAGMSAALHDLAARRPGGLASPVQAGAYTTSRARLCSIWNSRVSNSGALAAADAVQDLRGHGRRFAISATAISDYDSGGPIGQVL